jgi:uridine kinase
VVGIAGGTASGKSTLSQRLAAALDGLRVALLPMDRYFLSVKPKVVAPLSGAVYDDFNQPASFDLVALVRDLDALLTTRQEDAPDVIIVEGLMTLQDEAIRARLDLRLFVDTPADERIVRRLKRNMARGMDFDTIASYYLDSVRYRHQEFVEPSRWHAHLVLHGNTPCDLGIQVVVAWIRGQVCVSSGP